MNIEAQKIEIGDVIEVWNPLGMREETITHVRGNTATSSGLRLYNRKIWFRPQGLKEVYLYQSRATHVNSYYIKAVHPIRKD